MNQLKKIILMTSAVIALSVIAPVNAEHHEPHIDKSSKVTFQLVMQGLLSDTKMMTQGIILKDFGLVEFAANRIVNHPKPAMSQRKKLMKALGSDIATFKGYDHVVHDGAIKIKQAAKDKDMVVVIAEYQKVITGCQSCHSRFRAELSKALR
jgi:cytochrome c556